VYRTKSPVGRELLIPESVDEDCPSFERDDIAGAKRHYIEKGYVVMREVVPAADCDQLLRVFRETIKTYSGVIQRIESLPETHVFDEHGFMTNPIMNAHEQGEPRLKKYRNQTLGILTHKNVQSFLRAFHGSRIRLLTWNHFEANPLTHPHQDVFWGDKSVGDIIGTWVALEDIHAKAGRLYVGPFTHTMDMLQLARDRNIEIENMLPNDPAYRRLILQLIDEEIIACKAPSLRKGDVIFWDSRTVHGSLTTDEPRYSRSSLTGHFEAVKKPSPMDRCFNGIEIRNLRSYWRQTFDRGWSFLQRRMGLQ
jgi:phytanoyl-CoA hydroxylase